MTYTPLLNPSAGGTGTATTFTQGSLVFSGASGIYSQDNANLFWDDSSNRFGIRTNSPQSPLHVTDSSASSPTVIGLDNPNTTNNNGAVLSFRSTTTGTVASYVEFSAIRSRFTEHDSATRASNLSFFTSSAGSLGERVTIADDGQVGINSTTPAAQLDVRANSTDPAVLINQTGSGLALRVEDSANPDATPVVVTANGDVGIGTITPAEKLEVSNGDARIYGVTVGRGANAVATNTVVGFGSLASITTGAGNTAVGYGALADTDGDRNTGVGTDALSAATSGDDNTAAGYSALSNATTGNRNTALGSAAGLGITTGSTNTAIGADTLSNTKVPLFTGSDNTAVGANAMQEASAGASQNTAVGASALATSAAFSGTNNTAVGYAALTSISAASASNVAVGASALALATTGSFITAVGTGAIGLATSGGNNTVAVGALALANATGADNVAVGATAGDAITSGSENVFVGRNAGGSDTTGSDNVCVGKDAFGLAAGDDNVAVGHGALGIAGSSQNVAVGKTALSAYIGTTGNDQNTAVGYGAASNLTSGTNVICLGANAQASTPTTSNQAVIGNSITTFKLNTASTTAPNPGFSINTLTTRPEVNIGHDANSASAPFISFFIAGGNGTGAAITQAAGGGFGVLYTSGSDYRLKQDVETMDTEAALQRVRDLRPVKFRYSMQSTGPLVEGFIAHEAQAVVPQAVTHFKDAVDEDGNPRYQGIDQGQIVPVLTAAIKALARKVDALTTELAALKAGS